MGDPTVGNGRFKKLSWLAWGLLAIVGGVLAVWVVRRPASVQAVAAVTQPVVQTLVASGRVRTPARVTLGTPSSGLVQAVTVQEGQHVQQGEVLVLLADAEARAQLAVAQASVAQARARLEQVQGVGRSQAQENLAQANTMVERAQALWQRAKTLRREGSMTAQELETAAAERSLAESRSRAARAQLKGFEPGGVEVRVAQGQLRAAQAQVLAAQTRLAMLQVLAPANGTVLTRAVEPGEVVGPSSALLVLAPDGPTQLTVQLDERNLAVVMLGSRALASADAFAAQPFEASVQFMSPQVDPARGTVEIRLDVPNPPAFLRSDMTVSVEIETGRTARALTVAQTAVQDLAAPQPSVFVLEDGRLVKRPVTLGLRGDGVVEVVNGLSPGEEVVPPAKGLKAGMAVRAGAPVDAATPAQRVVP